MSDETIDADLRAAFELHRSRVLRLKRECLDELFAIHEMSPDTTDFEEPDTVRGDEWPTYGGKVLSQSTEGSANLYALIDDGTEPPLPEERPKIFAEIGVVRRKRVTLDLNPLTLPNDFKQLYTLTNKPPGPGLPSTNLGIPDAFDGLWLPLSGLKHPSEPDWLEIAVGLGTLDCEATAIVVMGGIKAAIEGGRWLCWCKHDSEDWSWRWATRVGHEQPPNSYGDVALKPGFDDKHNGPKKTAGS